MHKFPNLEVTLVEPERIVPKLCVEKYNAIGLPITCEGLTSPAGVATITTSQDYESSREILITVRGKFRERSTIGQGSYRIRLV